MDGVGLGCCAVSSLEGVWSRGKESSDVLLSLLCTEASIIFFHLDGHLLQTSLHCGHSFDAIRYKGIRVSVQSKPNRTNQPAKQPNSVKSLNIPHKRQKSAKQRETSHSRCQCCVCVYSPGVPNHPPVFARERMLPTSVVFSVECINAGNVS
jgi:hypothetical protein